MKTADDWQAPNSDKFKQLKGEHNQRMKVFHQQSRHSQFLDPNMNSVALSYQKVIVDLCNKYNLQKNELKPIFDIEKDREFLKVINMQVIHQRIIQELQLLSQKISKAKS